MPRSKSAKAKSAKAKPRSLRSNSARSTKRRSNSAKANSASSNGSHVNINTRNTRNIINANSGNKYNSAASFSGEVIPKLVNSFVIENGTFRLDHKKFAYYFLKVHQYVTEKMRHKMSGGGPPFNVSSPNSILSAIMNTHSTNGGNQLTTTNNDTAIVVLILMNLFMIAFMYMFMGLNHKAQAKAQTSITYAEDRVDFAKKKILDKYSEFILRICDKFNTGVTRLKGAGQLITTGRSGIPELPDDVEEIKEFYSVTDLRTGEVKQGLRTHIKFQ